MEELPEEELSMLKYFWQEKEDVERYVNFEKIKPILEKEYPEVLKAWNDFKASKKLMDLTIRNL